MPTRKRIVRRHITGDLGGYHQPDVSPPQLGQGYRSLAPVGLIGQALLPLADVGDRQGKIAIPFQRIHREVQVSVDGEHTGKYTNALPKAAGALYLSPQPPSP